MKTKKREKPESRNDLPPAAENFLLKVRSVIVRPIARLSTKKYESHLREVEFISFRLQAKSFEQTSVDQYWSKVCGMIFEVDK